MGINYFEFFLPKFCQGSLSGFILFIFLLHPLTEISSGLFFRCWLDPSAEPLSKSLDIYILLSFGFTRSFCWLFDRCFRIRSLAPVLLDKLEQIISLLLD